MKGSSLSISESIFILSRVPLYFTNFTHQDNLSQHLRGRSKRFLMAQTHIIIIIHFLTLFVNLNGNGR